MTLFLIFKSREHIELFLNYLNSQLRNIEFTCDKEIDNCLPFLDINIKRCDTSFSTSIYRKPTFTGLLSKFSSFSPLKYKENLISTLVYRGYQLNSSYLSFHKEIEFLRNILLSNGYPLIFIEKQIKRTLNKFYPISEKVIPQNVLEDGVPIEDKPVLFSAPFLGSHSDTVSSDLKCVMGKYLPKIKLRIVFKSTLAIGDLFRFKDKLPESCMANFIYKYTCESCNAFYIGKSYRQFRVRVFEHLGKSYRTDSLLKVPVPSHIREHCYERDHPLNPEKFAIIDRSHFKNDLTDLILTK